MSVPTTDSLSLTTFQDPVLNALTHGSKWTLDTTRHLTWAIASNSSYTVPNTTQTIIEFVLALIPITEVINVDFTYLGYYSDIRLSPADLTYTVASGQLARNMFSSGGLARAVFPYSPAGDAFSISLTGTTSGSPNAEGDVWLNGPAMVNSGNSGFWDGAAGKFILLHETGHALGLKHPHDNGGTNRPTFSSIGLSHNDRIEFSLGDGLDVDAFTVMSYNDDESFNLWQGDPATLMPLDIYALQALYGPNLATRSGDTIHTLVRDGAYRSIWDASGIDTIDVGTSDSGWIILMETRPSQPQLQEYFSKITLAIPALSFTGSSPTTLDWIYNAENVNGSTWNDIVLGNSLSNRIIGNAGNDIISAGDGNDTLSGGSGNDTLEGQAGNDLILEGGGNDVNDGGPGLDTLDLGNVRRSSASLTRQSANAWSLGITSTREVDSLKDIEYIKFSDSLVSLLDLALGTPTNPDSKGAQVFRFAKTNSGQYFYTGDISERNLIISNLPSFRYEGAVFNAQDNWVTGYNPVYRFANLLNGGYFYTSSALERDTVFSDYAATYRYEGASFFVPASATADTVPVYRLANVKTGGYLFTANSSERQFAQSLGFFRDEGVAFNAPRTISIAFDSSDETQLSNDFSAEISNAENAVISQFDWFV